MKRIPIFLSLFWLSCLQGIHVSGQEPVHKQLQDQVRTQVHDGVYTLVDFVDLTLFVDLTQGKQGTQDTLCTKEFLEEWIIRPREHTVVKQVLDHDSSCMALLMTLPERNGSKVIRNLSYEFNLLDPHLIASGNVAFSEPDSMDLHVRQLQEDLIELISGLSKTAIQYQLNDQLLSVIFHEDWSLNPVTRLITKEVRGITPVIWQRRQTVAGDPVNDGETGLPVYFKNQLERIDLRNP
ncbi:MAG: hypothetical protein ABFS28_15995 [Bacteroidota bacterium]